MPPAELVEYIVHVKTGDDKKAGTDANVFLEVHGNKGHIGLVRLVQSLGDPFHPGRNDKFVVWGCDVGEIQRISIGHDGSASGNDTSKRDWLVEKVILLQRESQFCSFVCHHAFCCCAGA